MNRVIVTAQGTKGDIHPMIGLALALKQRGFSVVLLANDYFREAVESVELEFHSVGQREDYEAAFAEGSYEDGTDKKFVAVYKGCFEKSIEPVYRYIERERHAHPNVIVVCPHYFDSSALMACEQFGLRAVQIALSPAQLRGTLTWPYNQLNAVTRRCVFEPLSFWKFCVSKRRRVHAHWEKRLNTGTHLSSVFHKPNYDQILQLGLFPQWFYEEPYADPHRRQLCQKSDPLCVGFPLYDQVKEEARAQASRLLTELEQPPLVFTSGTGIKAVDDFYSVSREVCHQLGLPGVFVCKDASKLESLSDHLVRPIAYVDFEYLLPRSRAVVHHGGIGTCAQAIRAGIPQIIRPLEYDQPDNGWRVTQLGLGGMILRDDYQAGSAAIYIRRILDHPTLTERVRHFSEQSKVGNALELAASEIERTFAPLKLTG